MARSGGGLWSARAEAFKYDEGGGRRCCARNRCRPCPRRPRVARAALSPNYPYLRLADELRSLFADEGFASLFPTHGQPALAPWRLALATILQFAEGLSDVRFVPSKP
jgi:hypothetical protein